MRFAIEGETGFGDKGVEDSMPARAAEIGVPIMRKAAIVVPYGGNEDPPIQVPKPVISEFMKNILA